MGNVQTIERMKELIAIIKKADTAHFRDDAPIMTDREYDLLVSELHEAEMKTGVVFSSSPTRKVSGEAKKGLNSLPHTKPMLSARKTKSTHEVRMFMGERTAICSWKLDGLSLILRYRDGKLVTALTRGDGHVGEDVTYAVRQCTSIPSCLKEKVCAEVRGECVISWDDARRMKGKSEEDVHPRNIAAGTLRSLFPDRGKLSKLRFFAFDLISDMDFQSKGEELRYLESLGLNTPFHIECSRHDLDAAIKQFVPENFQYPVDGLVFEYDDLRYGRSLGATQHHENRLLALKWSDEVVGTVFRGAELSTGRTGKVSITVSFDPVSVCGSTIRRALVSYSRFQELKLGVGDRIGVYKANMIIPQLAENYTLSGTYSLSEECPSCGKPLRLRKTLNGHSELCCDNECCLARNSRKIARYADKEAMNISGLSAVTMEKLMSMGWVSTYRDLYHLSDYEDEIINTPGFGIQSYQNMQTSIEKSRVTTLGRFLYSMSIPRLTHSAATSLSKYFHSSFEEFAAAMDSGFQLAEISDVTADIAKSVNDWYWNESSQVLWKPLIKELSFARSGYHVAGEKHGTCFSDSSIVITGTILGMTRRQCSEVLNLMGATLTESVSGNTDYLIVGQDPGGVKLADAMRLGVKIITLDEFLDMLAG